MDKPTAIYKRMLAVSGLIGAVSLLSGCVPRASALTSHSITVTFDTGTGCPISVSEPNLLVGKDDEVVWQSSPGAYKYRLWLVPFKGTILSPAKSRNPMSDSNGRVATTFSQFAPAGATQGGAAFVKYKYSIQSNDINGTPCLPLDPHIRIG